MKHQDNVLRQKYADWIAEKAAGKAMLEVTLTLYQSLPGDWLKGLERIRDLPRTKRALKVAAVKESRRTGGWVPLTRTIEQYELAQLLVRIHRKLGGPYRAGIIRLTTMFSFEGDGVTQHRHIHGLIEIPGGYTTESFVDLVRRSWQASVWAQERNEFELADSNIGFAYYMTKTGLDNLDCGSLHI